MISSCAIASAFRLKLMSLICLARSTQRFKCQPDHNKECRRKHHANNLPTADGGRLYAAQTVVSSDDEKDYTQVNRVAAFENVAEMN